MYAHCGERGNGDGHYRFRFIAGLQGRRSAGALAWMRTRLYPVMAHHLGISDCILMVLLRYVMETAVEKPCNIDRMGGEQREWADEGGRKRNKDWSGGGSELHELGQKAQRFACFQYCCDTEARARVLIG